MFTRKQLWRRVRCRSRTKPRADSPAANNRLGMIAEIELIDLTSTTMSSPSSVESIVSSDGEDTEEKKAPPSPPATNARAKSVTFEPRPQVFLVTHMSELDSR